MDNSKFETEMNRIIPLEGAEERMYQNILRKARTEELSTTTEKKRPASRSVMKSVLPAAACVALAGGVTAAVIATVNSLPTAPVTSETPDTSEKSTILTTIMPDGRKLTSRDNGQTWYNGESKIYGLPDVYITLPSNEPLCNSADALATLHSTTDGFVSVASCTFESLSDNGSEVIKTDIPLPDNGSIGNGLTISTYIPTAEIAHTDDMCRFTVELIGDSGEYTVTADFYTTDAPDAVPDNGTVLLTISPDGDTEYRSTDNGVTWTANGEPFNGRPQVYVTLKDNSPLTRWDDILLTMHNTSVFREHFTGEYLRIQDGEQWLAPDGYDAAEIEYMLSVDGIDNGWIHGIDTYIPLSGYTPCAGRYRTDITMYSGYTCAVEFTVSPTDAIPEKQEDDIAEMHFTDAPDLREVATLDKASIIKQLGYETPVDVTTLPEYEYAVFEAERLDEADKYRANCYTEIRLECKYIGTHYADWLCAAAYYVAPNEPMGALAYYSKIILVKDGQIVSTEFQTKGDMHFFFESGKDFYISANIQDGGIYRVSPKTSKLTIELIQPGDNITIKEVTDKYIHYNEVVEKIFDIESGDVRIMSFSETVDIGSWIDGDFYYYRDLSAGEDKCMMMQLKTGNVTECTTPYSVLADTFTKKRSIVTSLPYTLTPISRNDSWRSAEGFTVTSNKNDEVREYSFGQLAEYVNIPIGHVYADLLRTIENYVYFEVGPANEYIFGFDPDSGNAFIFEHGIDSPYTVAASTCNAIVFTSDDIMHAYSYDSESHDISGTELSEKPEIMTITAPTEEELSELRNDSSIPVDITQLRHYDSTMQFMKELEEKGADISAYRENNYTKVNDNIVYIGTERADWVYEASYMLRSDGVGLHYYSKLMFIKDTDNGLTAEEMFSFKGGISTWIHVDDNGGKAYFTTLRGDYDSPSETDGGLFSIDTETGEVVHLYKTCWAEITQTTDKYILFNSHASDGNGKQHILSLETGRIETIEVPVGYLWSGYSLLTGDTVLYPDYSTVSVHDIKIDEHVGAYKLDLVTGDKTYLDMTYSMAMNIYTDTSDFITNGTVRVENSGNTYTVTDIETGKVSVYDIEEAVDSLSDDDYRYMVWSARIGMMGKWVYIQTVDNMVRLDTDTGEVQPLFDRGGFKDGGIITLYPSKNAFVVAQTDYMSGINDKTVYIPDVVTYYGRSGEKLVSRVYGAPGSDFIESYGFAYAAMPDAPEYIPDSDMGTVMGTGEKWKRVYKGDTFGDLTVTDAECYYRHYPDGTAALFDQHIQYEGTVTLTGTLHHRPVELGIGHDLFLLPDIDSFLESGLPITEESESFTDNSYNTINAVQVPIIGFGELQYSDIVTADMFDENGCAKVRVTISDLRMFFSYGTMSGNGINRAEIVSIELL